MDYKLALELKEVGFPHKHQFDAESECIYGANNVGEDHTVCYPSLSELIAACGVFDALICTNRKPNWTATDGNGHDGEGDTPEEAVARLWLALNKKE